MLPLFPRRDDTTPEIAFWQNEAHYFEERARTQGSGATQMVTISIATLVLGAVPIAIDIVAGTQSASTPNADSALTNYFLLAVPAIALLLWMTALRFLTEMFRLVAYYDRADNRVAALYAEQGWAGEYITWKQVGGKNPILAPGNIAWFLIAGVAQIFATTLYIWMFFDREGGNIFGFWWGIWVVLGIVATVLVIVVIIVRECLTAEGLTHDAIDAAIT